MRGVAQHYPDRIETLSVNPARVVSPDVAEIGRIEGLGLDLWKSGAASTRASTSRSAPVSSSTRARDARRSHRSVEGDKKLCVERVETPILYKRVLLFSPIRSRPVWGGGGLVSDFEHQNLVVHLGLGRASWQGTQGLPPPLRRPLCPSWRAGFAPIPTKSGASRASGLICGSWERRRPGPASAASRSPQKIVGGIGGGLELGANTYRVLVHPTSTTNPILGVLVGPAGHQGEHRRRSRRQGRMRAGRVRMGCLTTARSFLRSRARSSLG